MAASKEPDSTGFLSKRRHSLSSSLPEGSGHRCDRRNSASHDHILNLNKFQELLTKLSVIVNQGDLLQADVQEVQRGVAALEGAARYSGSLHNSSNNLSTHSNRSSFSSMSLKSAPYSNHTSGSSTRSHNSGLLFSDSFGGLSIVTEG